MPRSYTTFPPDWAANPAETLAALLHPGHWLLEAGRRPPPAHSRTAGPSLASASGMAVSLRTASLLPLMLGCLLIDRVEAAGCPIGPLGGLALHEIITNAAIHGNLAVHTGRALQWEDLVLRQQRIETALTDPLYADRLVTIVLAWNARGLRAAVLDEGAGLCGRTALRRGARRPACGGAGVGHRPRGRAGDNLPGRAVHQAGLRPRRGGGRPVMTGIAAPIIVLDPDVAEARLLAGWLRSAGLGRIAVARTCDEALFLLGRSNADLLIIDEAVSAASEQRLLLHIAACGHAPPPAIVRLLAEGSAGPGLETGARTAETVRKPLEAHDAVVRVGTALQRPDLVGRLDSNRDQSSAHIDMARGMQLALLPTEAQLDALQSACGAGLAGLCRPGEAVGGDFWGAWPTGEGGFALTVADFAGHGLSAALNTFRLHAILDEQTLPRGEPSRMTDVLNRRLHSLLQRGQYATMIYAQIEPASGYITWCSAGGPQPMFVSPGGILDLDGRGLPLGVKPDAIYSQSRMRMTGGGILCMFSDGLYEGGLGSPDIEREEIGAALSGPAALAASGRLREAAGQAIVELEKLRDRHVCLEHSDDVMVVCAALAAVD